MPTCLIMGIDSFTGTYVKDIFKNNGYHVFGTSYLPQFKITDASVFSVDLLKIAEIDAVIKQTKPEVVIHLAGISYVVSDNPKPFYDVHISGTHNLLKSLADSAYKPSKVILASTAQVYGDNPNPNEKTNPNPLNDYAVSKLAMEYMTKIWMKKLPIIIARPFNYIGVGQSKNFIIPKLITAFKNKQAELEIGKTDMKRDFSDVRFIAQCYYSLATRGKAGETYNLASAKSYSVQYLIDELTHIAQFQPMIKLNPAFIRPNDPPMIVGNNEKISAIDHNISPIPITKTLEWIYHD